MILIKGSIEAFSENLSKKASQEERIPKPGGALDAFEAPNFQSAGWHTRMSRSGDQRYIQGRRWRKKVAGEVSFTVATFWPLVMLVGSEEFCQSPPLDSHETRSLQRKKKAASPKARGPERTHCDVLI